MSSSAISVPLPDLTSGVFTDTTSRDTAVSVRGLAKSYSIAKNAVQHSTVGEALIHKLKNPLAKPERDTFWALNDVNFDIQKGDVVGIIGRNGAGKSTLLKILSRITEPTRGKIDLYGRVGSLLEVGTGFHPELTGRENVYLNGAILGMQKSEIARQFDAIVDFSGTEQFLDTPVKRYSSGMYVRLAFAVAAHLNPEILIIDEVLAVGDAEFQKKCLGKMQDVAAGGRTVIFVSHNMAAVRNLCKSILWMQQGRLHASGAASQIIDNYLKKGFEETGSILNLTNIARNAGLDARFRLREVIFNNGQPIRHGEKFHIRLNYETHTPLEDIAVGFGFSTLDGVRLMTFESDHSGQYFTLPRKTAGYLDIAINSCWLQPGQYSFDVGARSSTNSPLDYVPACAVIEVLPGYDTPDAIYDGTGGVRPPATWLLNE